VFEESVIPELRGEPGYEACYVLTTPEGKALVLTLWEDEQAAADSIATGLYGAQVEKFVTVIRSAPGRDSYDVAVADTQALSV
jgi:heme-degrading monooxygenase HmoA